MGEKCSWGKAVRMSKVLILVEGPTEEQFVKLVLRPYFESREIHLIPTILNTKIMLNGPNFKGGISSYEQVRRDLLPLLGDSSAATVTTMIDFYGLPDEFPGKGSLPAGTCYDCVRHIEQEFAGDISHNRFMPYIQLHEFEALLFSSPMQIADIFENSTAILGDLNGVTNQFANPEEIDDDPDGHPFARLEKIIPGFQKLLDGTLIAEEIGLDQMRAECEHFAEWIVKLESL